jgi:agmatinase
MIAEHIISSLEGGIAEDDPRLRDFYAEVNHACETMCAWVKERTRHWQAQGKRVGVIGGDHSSPLGYFQHHAENHESFGLLVIDAHLDLRKAYEGFTYSHASIFHNALVQLPQIKTLVQIGIRDYCHEEKDFARMQGSRVHVYYERDMRQRLYRGETWDALCNEIVATLPDVVHISVDIDGLDPHLCPNTGTPVPGGLQYEELMYLLNTLRASGKTVIGFDLCEVSPGDDDWDGNVGARVLFQLCGML